MLLVTTPCVKVGHSLVRARLQSKLQHRYDITHVDNHTCYPIPANTSVVTASPLSLPVSFGMGCMPNPAQMPTKTLPRLATQLVSVMEDISFATLILKFMYITRKSLY